MRLESETEKIRDLAPTGVRIPTKLKMLLKEWAKLNNRSMHAEIVARLEKSIFEDGDPEQFKKRNSSVGILEDFDKDDPDDLKILKTMEDLKRIAEAMEKIRDSRILSNAP